MATEADKLTSTDKLSADALASEAGVVARFKSPGESVFSVSPTASSGFNTLRRPLRPSACWRIDDLRFDFDSSFIKPDAAKEFALLASLRSPTATGEAALLLSVFGHADPTGEDDYNKTLSGRRATAVYALLVRDAALWEELYSQPFRGDAWSTKHIQIMLRALEKGKATLSGQLDQPTTEAIKLFQREVGLSPSGFPGTDTRKQLFLQYMDALCRDANAPFRYTPEDFVSRGASADGKADRQGCSELNPIFVVSQEQAKEFEKPANKAARDLENLSNRRVVVYMFSPKLQLSPANWPCPTVKEGIGGCKAQLFPDADKRRNPQELPRQYLHGGRTFGCKFYDRLVRGSPCEAVRQNLVIFLLDHEGQPSFDAPYRLKTGSQVLEGTTDAKGRIVEHDVLASVLCEVEWGVPNDDRQERILPNYARFFLNATGSPEKDPDLTRRQLANLAYRSEFDIENRQAFEDDYQRDATDDAIDAVHRNGIPRPKASVPT